MLFAGLLFYCLFVQTKGCHCLRCIPLFNAFVGAYQRKKLLTKEDVKNRARKAIKWQISNGIQFVRTHVDVTDKNLIALKAMIEIKEEFKDFITLQIVAFPQEGILSYPKGFELLEESLLFKTLF